MHAFTLDGYKIVKHIGSGALGQVYRCVHKSFSHLPIAVKILSPHFVQNDDARARFKHEFLSTYLIDSPYVVKAYELIEDDSILAYSMEYVDGGCLGENISHLLLKEKLDVYQQLARGLQVIHSSGIVHRDLKPENILYDIQNNVVKITDFGIASSRFGEKLTSNNAVLGTIEYLSPEYIEKGTFDTRSDLFALGVIGYELFADESPFDNSSILEALKSRVEQSPIPPHVKSAECPMYLSRCIVKLLERDTNRRYQSARELSRDLSRGTKTHMVQEIAISLDKQIREVGS